MNHIYNTNFQAYYDKNLPVTPLIGKAPFLKNWNELESERPYKKGDNIGLILGKRSGIIALDIDTEDKELQKKILNVLPPIKCGKTGNKDRLPTVFFQYNGEKSQKIKGIVEILSDGNQTVLPPSIHPDKGYAYEWVGEELLNINIDDLPTMSKEIVDGLSKVLRSQVQAPSFGGRHNTLVKIMGGKIMDNLEPSEIINDCIQYDEIHHSPPYFTDKSEPHGGHGYASALSMLNSIVQTQARKGEIYKPAPRIEINLNERIEKPKFKKLPKLRGIGQSLFDEIYHNSPIPRTQFSFASAINTVSTLIGAKVMIDDFGANVFQYLIAPSNFGKDHPEKIGKRLLRECGSESRISSGSPTSETAVLAQTELGRNRCFFINEAEKFLKRMNDSRSNHGLREIMPELFDCVGEYSSQKTPLSNHGKEKLQTFGGVFSPFINLYLVSTERGFTDNMHLDSFDTGFGGRFLYYFEDRYKDVIPRGLYKPNTALVKQLTQIRSATPWGKIEIEPLDLKLPFKIPQLENTPCGNEAKIDVGNKIKIERRQAHENESKFEGLVGRKWAYVVKFAIIDHVFLHGGDYLNNSVKGESWYWAYEAITAIHQNMLIKLDTSVNTSTNDKHCNAVYSYIEKRYRVKNKETSMKEIHKRFSNLELSYRKKITQDLLEQGKIKKMNSELFVPYFADA